MTANPIINQYHYVRQATVHYISIITSLSMKLLKHSFELWCYFDRSPDSALQSGLESRAKFTPSGPMLWKGFISMQDFAKFFTSAYRVSGPAENLVRFVGPTFWDVFIVMDRGFLCLQVNCSYFNGAEQIVYLYSRTV